MTRSFPINVILGLTTGIALTPFSEIHELAEWVMGGPLWTHEFADPSLCVLLRERVLAQHPDLRGAPKYVKGTFDLDIYLRENVALYGAERAIEQGAMHAAAEEKGP